MKMPSRWIVLLIIFSLCTAGAQAEETFFFIDTPSLSAETMAGYLQNIYVAEDGNDNGAGRLEDPLQTLEQALIYASTVETDEAVTIWLRGGTYFVGQTIYVSGTMGKEIIVRGYADETPVITGATRIDNWVETSYQGRTLWSATITAPEIRALYGEDGARQVSRWPKTGTLTVARAETEAEDKFENHQGFFVDPQEVPSSIHGATVRLLHWWKDELSGVRSYDPLSGYLMMNRPTAMSIEAGQRYWLENVVGMTLEDGEWAYDASLQTLYYAPLPGESVDTTPLYAGLTERLMAIVGISGITFDRITFARTGWSIPHNDQDVDFPQAAYDAGAAVFVGSAQNVKFTSCHFEDIGSGCILLGEMVQNATVYNCTFEDIGAQAVYVHGLNLNSEEMRTQGITIENNEINGYGRNFLNAAAILIIHARDVDISYNEIHDGTYTAISAGWVWGDDFSATDSIRIRNNLIYFIGQSMLSDMGAIYLLGSQPGTLVSGNIIHDVTQAEYGGWGIYLDEGSSQITVSNNLVYRCSAQGFHLHSASNNLVQNNIFAFNRDGQVGGSGVGSFTLSHNLIVGPKPQLNRPDTIKIEFDDNIYRENGDIFVDAANDNFNIADASDLTAAGFVQWVFVAGRYTQ